MGSVAARAMELTVIGAGPAYTDRAGATGAAYLLGAGDATLLLDFGQGSFPALASRLEPSTLDGIVISHLHPDHFIDLVALRHYLRFEFEPPRRVRVLAPADLAARLDALHADPAFTRAALDVEPIRVGEQAVGPFCIEAALVTHTDESYGFRVTVDDGATTTPTAAPARPGLVYSGDCGVAADLRPLIRPGDALLTEISFGAGPVAPGAWHLDGPAIGDLAATTGVSRVLLTHLQMGFDRSEAIASVRARYGGPVELVDPGFSTEIGGDPT